ncbi:MAG: hypothetical protein M1831_002197 [Alyxoria varia]|nr:MAG: hypothetical protein M1831_002197 [Alyxoria varia]
MFLAAAPYFQTRLHSQKSLLRTFQPAELSVSTVAMLGSTFILALPRLQASANYPKRISAALLLNSGTFVLLAASTQETLEKEIGARGYFTVIMLTAFLSSIGTGLMQNGIFAFVLGDFGGGDHDSGVHSKAGQRKSVGEIYMQGIMVGQAVAGVLPPIVEIASVLGLTEGEGKTVTRLKRRVTLPEQSTADGGEAVSSTSAFSYFITATGVSAVTLLAFFYLLAYRRPRSRLDAETIAPNRGNSQTPLSSQNLHDDRDRTNLGNSDSSSSALEPPVGQSSMSRVPSALPLRELFRHLTLPSIAVFLTFAISMVMPVFTAEITSTHPPPRPPLLRDAAFIPFALLIWNAGDLAGRILPLWYPFDSLAWRPGWLAIGAVARVVFIPAYGLCNVGGRVGNIAGTSAAAEHGPAGVVLPDLVYLLVVQFLFGLSNGYLGSCCMMGAPDILIRSLDRNKRKHSAVPEESDYLREDLGPSDGGNLTDPRPPLRKTEEPCEEEAAAQQQHREAAGAFMGLCLVAGLAVGSFCSFFVGVDLG